MAPSQASSTGIRLTLQSRLTPANALLQLHWILVFLFSPVLLLSYSWAQGLLSTLLQLSVASHMTQTRSVASKYTKSTLLVGGRGGSITIATKQKAPAEQHTKGSACCLNLKTLSCKDTHTQRRSGCSLQRACSPLLRSGGYAGSHDAAGCQHQSHTSF